MMIGWTKNLAVALFPVMTLVVSFGAAGTAEATQGCAEIAFGVIQMWFETAND